MAFLSLMHDPVYMYERTCLAFDSVVPFVGCTVVYWSPSSPLPPTGFFDRSNRVKIACQAREARRRAQSALLADPSMANKVLLNKRKMSTHLYDNCKIHLNVVNVSPLQFRRAFKGCLRCSPQQIDRQRLTHFL